MALMNFVDKVTTVTAAWLNAVDVLKETIFENATSKAEARTRLTADAPLEVVNGGTGARTAADARTNLGVVVPFPITAIETALGIVPNTIYQVGDLRRYGGDPTGVSPSDTALANAIDVCAASNGGTITAPGSYIFANQYDVSQLHGIVIQGAGGPTSSNTNGTVLTYTGTASPWITAGTTSGFLVKNLTLNHSNAGFSGTYIKYGEAVVGSPSTQCGLDDVALGSSVSLCRHVDLDKTINFSATRCLFQYGGPSGSVSGQDAAGGSYSIAVAFRDCEWTACSTVPVQTGGEAWRFDGCVFEALSGATHPPGGFSNNPTCPANGMSFTGCWFGDATSGAGTWISFAGNGLSVTGCSAGGNPVSDFIDLYTAKGVDVRGNYFASFSAVVSFGDANSKAVVVAGNYGTGLGTWIGSSADAPANLVYNPNDTSNIASPIAPPSTLGLNGSKGWREDANGVIEQWGYEAVTAGTPVPVTFSKVFPNALWNVQLTVVSPAAGGNVGSVTSPTATGLTLNVTGAGANTVHWRAYGN